jgi:hypothetical protein
MCSMLILLDRDGLVLGTLDYTEAPDTILVDELGMFEYEDTHGEDHVYRQVE